MNMNAVGDQKTDRSLEPVPVHKNQDYLLHNTLPSLNIIGMYFLVPFIVVTAVGFTIVLVWYSSRKIQKPEFDPAFKQMKANLLSRNDVLSRRFNHPKYGARGSNQRGVTWIILILYS
ncbi:hypothetical protein K492DRAFT_183223 [Lichtheimia hyalospora FSU 10163]|nr:hypothetical protein K492DRAFT_183223 [Lichtheimia hyalospora FSU 10163]